MVGIEYYEMLAWGHLEGWSNARELLRRSIMAWKEVGIIEKEEKREENDNSNDDDVVIVVVGDEEKMERRM